MAAAVGVLKRVPRRLVKDENGAESWEMYGVSGQREGRAPPRNGRVYNPFITSTKFKTDYVPSRWGASKAMSQILKATKTDMKEHGLRYDDLDEELQEARDLAFEFSEFLAKTGMPKNLHSLGQPSEVHIPDSLNRQYLRPGTSSDSRPLTSSGVSFVFGALDVDAGGGDEDMGS